MIPALSSVSLSSLDYIIFGATLVVSTLIGVYYGCFGNRQSSLKDYLMAGKTMSIIPIAVSLTVSHFSGTAILGAPAEVFRYGASVWLTTAGFVVMGVLAVYVYLPVFYNLQLTSIYEYLEKRFDRRARMLAFLLYALSEIMNFPVHVYSPSLTFSTASGVNLNLTALVLCATCIFYTTLGGLKSVIWTDAFQFLVIMISLVAVCVLGFNVAGGFLSVWNIAKTHQRLDIFNFGFDLTQRDTFWGNTIGVGAHFLGQIVVHQSGFQKFLSLPKFSSCVWAVVGIPISFFLAHTFMIFIGLVAYAVYKDCDPLTSHKIAKHDQLFPYFLTDMAGNVPGIAGLFTAAVASASLSSMSSNLNAFCAVIYKDFLQLLIKKKLSEKQTAFVLKLVVLVFGILCTCLIFVIEQLGDLFIITLIISGITHGPLLGVFTLGVLFPKASAKGAFYGTIGGFVGVLTHIVLTTYYQVKGFTKSFPKPLSISGCEIFNETTQLVNTSFTTPVSVIKTEFQPNAIFRISFQFYTLVGALITIIIGLVISHMTKSVLEADKSLLSPIVHRWLPNDRRSGKVSHEMTEVTSQLLTK